MMETSTIPGTTVIALSWRGSRYGRRQRASASIRSTSHRNQLLATVAPD
jgi:hypothetical protein